MKFYAGNEFIGRGTAVGLAISAGDLRNKTSYQSGELLLLNSLLDDRFGGETRQIGFSASYSVGLRSGEFNNHLMTGAETRFLVFNNLLERDANALEKSLYTGYLDDGLYT